MPLPTPRVFKRLLSAAAPVALLLTLGGPAAGVWPYDAPAKVSTDELLAQVRERYDRLSDFKAQLTVVATSAAMGDSYKQSGVIYARQPNLFRIEFADPSPQTVVFDGTYMYAYVPGETRVLRYEGAGLAGLVNLPQTLDDLRQNYDLKLTAETKASYELHLVSRTANAYYPTMTLWILKDQLVISRADLFDAAGNCTSYRFAAFEFDLGVSPSRFKLDAPANAEIVDMGAAF